MTSESTPRTLNIFGDSSFRRTAIISLLVLVAYYFTAKIGFRFALQPGSVSTLWMPNSILLAGLLLTTSRWWWLVVLAALPSHLAAELQSGVPTAMVLSWFVSNSLQALIGAFLIRAFINSDIRFDRMKDLVVFLCCGAFLAPFLSSFLDSGLVKLNGWGHASFWGVWRLRFLSNVLATLTLVPFVIAWAQGGVATVRGLPISRYIEAGLLMAVLFAVSFFVFETQHNDIEQTPWQLYLPLPFLVWATVRFGLRGVSTSLLVVVFLAIIGASKNAGPFVTGSSTNNALSIQAFLIVVSVPLIVLAAVIEERRLTEATARYNEECLTLALSAAQMNTWDWDIGNNNLMWSEATRATFGFASAVTPTLAAFYQVVHPDDRAAVQLAVSRALKDGAPYEVEFRAVRNGITRWFLSKGKVFFSNSGEPLRMLGVGIDITDRKETEQALAETNERNQAILRAIPDMMFLLDKEGVYLDYYTRDANSLLVPPDQFLGRKVSEVLPKDLAEQVYEVINRLNGTDEAQVLEHPLPIRDEVRHYEARLVSAEGNKVLCMVRDITEARRAAEAIRESENRLLQSTQQIRMLAARLIAAQESERRRISILLHDDVGQNVAALGLAISRLKRKIPNSSEQMTWELDILGSQVRELTAQLRQLSHELHPEVLDHVGLVKALESHVTEFSAEEKLPIKFSAHVETSPIPQEIAACLYRVALEAVSNVAKHSGAMSANVALTEGDGFLELEVSDSGHGFDVDKARRGSGLGLVSSEERIRLLQGTLEICSNHETGTRFRARVPLPVTS